MSKASATRRWFTMIEHLAPECDYFDLILTVGHAGAEWKAQPLYAQFLRNLAIRLERFVEVIAKGQFEDAALEAKLDQVGEGLCTPRDIDVMLTRHIDSCKKLITKGSKFVAILNDKAQVKGMNLLNSVLVLPTNHGILAPPQVWRNARAQGRSEAKLQSSVRAPSLGDLGVYGLCLVYKTGVCAPHFYTKIWLAPFLGRSWCIKPRCAHSLFIHHLCFFPDAGFSGTVLRCRPGAALSAGSGPGRCPHRSSRRSRRRTQRSSVSPLRRRRRRRSRTSVTRRGCSGPWRSGPAGSRRRSGGRRHGTGRTQRSSARCSTTRRRFRIRPEIPIVPPTPPLEPCFL